MKAVNKTKTGQSMVEYSLLLVVAILALLAANYVLKIKGGSFESHFNRAKDYIGGYYIP